MTSGGGQDNVNILADPIPKQGTNPEDVESQIAIDMTQVSAADRERAYFDLHGIPNHPSETPQLIQSSLERLDQEVQRLGDKAAYEMAEAHSSGYVRDCELRLAFLRADMFDAKKAALRLVRFFQAKLDLFGTEKLAMDITQDDLDHDDMNSLYSGYGRFLDQPDQTGRAVATLFSNDEQLDFSAMTLVSFTLFRKCDARSTVSSLTHTYTHIRSCGGSTIKLWLYARVLTINDGVLWQLSSG